MICMKGMVGGGGGDCRTTDYGNVDLNKSPFCRLAGWPEEVWIPEVDNDGEVNAKDRHSCDTVENESISRCIIPS